MKQSKRNLVILAAVIGAVCYGTFLVVGSTVVPIREYDSAETPKIYQRSLQMRLYELVTQKKFAEAEIVFKRIRKLAPDNRSVLKLGSVVCYHNGKFNEAENLLRNLLLRNPGDFVCRNNYAMVLMAKGRREAFKELGTAWKDSGEKAFVGKNLQYCAKRFKLKLPDDFPADLDVNLTVPFDAICVSEEKK